MYLGVLLASLVAACVVPVLLFLRHVSHWVDTKRMTKWDWWILYDYYPPVDPEDPYFALASEPLTHVGMTLEQYNNCYPSILLSNEELQEWLQT